MFSGGPAWVELFGDRGTGNFRESGHGPNYRDDDVQGMSHLENALLGAAPPTLSVIHISETDFAAHQFGTTASSYADVMHFWDGRLNQFLDSILLAGTTVIITADHGNDLLGSHGGSDAIYRRVPVLMWGAGVKAGAKVEMQARDMPATIAVLLGLPAPAGVPGLPAVEAFDMPSTERAQILRTAYEHSVLNNPVVLRNPELRARASLPLDQAAFASARLQSAPAGDNISGYRAVLTELESQLSPTRVWKVVDWVFVLLSFGCAFFFGRFAARSFVWEQGRSKYPLRTWGALFLLVECLFVVRIVFAAPIKHALHGPRLGFQVAVLIIGMSAAVALYVWRRRIAALAWIEEHLAGCIIVGYFLVTIIRPWDTLGLLGITMLAAYMVVGRWPLRVCAITLGVFAAYFMFGSWYLWPMLGERMAARYVVGLPVAGVGIVAWALLYRRYSPGDRVLPYAQLTSLGMLLVLLPAGGLGLVGWSSADYGPLASLVLVAMCLCLRTVGGPPWWAWFGPLLVVAFWWWPNPALFSNALGTCFLILCLALAQYRERQDCRMATFVLLSSMLLLMSTPAKALSLFLLLGVLLAFMVSTSSHDSVDRPSAPIVVAALFVLTCRYAIFNLFGNSDSMLTFGLQDIDIGSAYVGNHQREIVPAISLALLKIWVAGAILFAALGLFPHWRRWLLSVAAFAAMFALINVGQTSVQAALATGARTAQYEWAAFSVFASTGIFVFGMLSFAVFATFAGDSAAEDASDSVAPA